MTQTGKEEEAMATGNNECQKATKIMLQTKTEGNRADHDTLVALFQAGVFNQRPYIKGWILPPQRVTEKMHCFKLAKYCKYCTKKIDYSMQGPLLRCHLRQMGTARLCH